MVYSAVYKDDYEKTVRMGQRRKVSCYSVAQFEERKKSMHVEVVGEVLRKNRQEEIHRMLFGEKEFRVSSYGGHSPLLYRVDGYVNIGGDQYVALLNSRAPFFLSLFLELIVAILLVGFLSFYLSETPVIAPYNPLPLEDAYAQEIPGDTGTPAEQEGGSVSLVYSLDADLSLSTGEIGIYFQNPGTSNHDVVLELYIVSGGEETLIAESGRIAAGKGLYRLSMLEDAAILSEGLYKGKFKVIFYDPDTGEKALVESDITDLTLTVTN